MRNVEILPRDLASLAVVYAPVAELRGWDRNPRRIKPARLEQLKQMLVSSPEMLKARPLICLPDGTVIAGNQRLAAAQALGWESIPAVFVDLDEATAIEWAFRDNNPAGESDDDLAAVLLADLAERGRALDLTGFAPSELSALLRRVAPKNDPDAVPPVPAVPKSERGEVYELGAHRLMCGDATSAEDVSALAGGAASAVLWTDPPYGVDYVGKTAAALRIQGDSADGLPALLVDAFVTAALVLVERAPFYIASPAGPRHEDFLLALRGAGWELHETLVWVKDVFVLGHSDYHYRHEPILYGYLPGTGRPGRGRHAGSRWRGDHRQSTVFEVPRPKRSEEHPTMKPVDLIVAQLANSTEPGDAVLDIFAGSGSTMLACEQIDCCAYLLEIDPAYCDVIRQRYADYVGDQKWAP